MTAQTGPDWGVGSYERTAAMLLPAAEALVSSAQLQPGERVLDLGCGTGNVALQAARRGAHTVAVDPAPRLREVTQEAAAAEGLAVEVLAGSATVLPLSSGSVDVVLSNFAIIFDQDPAGAVAEVARVLAPGGRVLLSAWLPGGAIAQMVGACMGMVSAAMNTPSGPPPFPWHDPAALAPLFAPHGLAVGAQSHTLAFTGTSPEAYLDAELTHHPMARSGFALLETKGEAEQARRRLLAILDEGNEDPAAFCATSGYVIVTAS